MNQHYKLYWRYIFFNLPIFFLKTKSWSVKNWSFLCFYDSIYYTVLFLKMSTFFYPSQFVELFSYELPTNQPFKGQSINYGRQQVYIVYNFQNLLTQKRFFIFSHNKKFLKKNSFCFLNSITNLFPNANWLERELSEMTGSFFYGKQDTRNLMLPYGDNSSPLKKFYPSIGFREIVYDSVNDILILQPTSIQF